MLFFDDKLLLKYSGVTGRILALSRAETTYDAYGAARTALDAARDAYNAARATRAYDAYGAARDALDATLGVRAARAARDAYDAAARAAHDAAARAAHDAYDAAARAAYNAAIRASARAAARAAHDAAREHTKLFKPFESSSDAALSALSIVSAPLLLTLLALDEMLLFIVSSLKSIYNFVSSKPDEAKELGAEAVGHLFNAVKALLAAVVSPVVNTVDFVGSCVATSKITNLSGDGQDTFNAEENFDSPRV